MLRWPALVAILLMMAPLGVGIPDTDNANTDHIGWINSPGAADDPIVARDSDYLAYISVAEDMHERWVANDAACDPDAIFGLLYLITTAAVGDLVAKDHFADNPMLVAWDRDFADRYFAAYDAYHAGEPTPGPWRVAFEHADSGKSTISEDQLLGINAHVLYDLAFSAYAMGLPQQGLKDEFDRVNDAFWNVVINDEFRARYEPETPPSKDPENQTVVDQASMESLIAMREVAWANAVALADAPTQEAFDAVAAAIEAEATAAALAIAQNDQDTWQERQAYCFSTEHAQLPAHLGGPGYGYGWLSEPVDETPGRGHAYGRDKDADPPGNADQGDEIEQDE